ncbi:MAG: bifunctional folylpolyglutamate synthase/dihydrofolate synthase, partial [Mogibacterium sp.]|nr:bifunctional folylpolyglutamate synthase/dihydrofolate synthase [Mogibacterium sp.]
MDYFEAREYLDEISASGSILGLETIRSLMNELGNPQDRLKVIHIAGTNGKGSILAITESILKTAGYTVGAYCSPSVMGYLEKFRINGNWMAEEELAPLTEQVKAAAEAVVEKGSAMPTVFEFETAVAFLHFCQKECDYVLLETGLGGDLDSTNVMANTEICAFGPISMDHTGVLGGSIEEIAEKKAGIIKPGATVIEGWQSKRAASVLEARAEELGCRLVKIDRLSLRELGSDRKNKLQRF